MSIVKRKKDHVEICLNRAVNFQKRNGFEKYELVHNALADFNFADIDVTSEFLGRKLAAPVIISSMTGGFPEAEKINKNLAAACQKLRIAMSCGSQKAMIKNEKMTSTYKIRDVAPDILYIGNIGLDYLKNDKNFATIKLALEAIEGDGIFVHLNLAQELVQAEGERNFANSSQNLTNFVKFMNLPVLAKEVGFGVSAKVANKIEKAGVKAIDVAGAGGTSWTQVEKYRQNDPRLADRFSNWGIPTAESLIECRKEVKISIIASGGIYDGVTACKAFALGADLVGLARPLLFLALQGQEEVKKFLENFILELKTAMMLVGVKNISELKGNREVIKNNIIYER